MSTKGVALVTGAGQGIGRAIALRLADDGFDVALNDISTASLEELAKEIRSKQRKTSLHVVDVSVDRDVKKMVEDVVREHGSLDVMVANAGIIKWKLLLSTTEEEWDKLFAVNVKGTFLCYKHAGAQMVAQGRGGRIIGACSSAGKRGDKYLSAYASTKFAIRGLTQGAASELGEHGITVNAYAPGAIDTALLRSLDDVNIALGRTKPGEMMDTWINNTVVGRVGAPDDVAALVSYLASEESSFVTGQSISCNGGIFFD